MFRTTHWIAIGLLSVGGIAAVVPTLPLSPAAAVADDATPSKDIVDTAVAAGQFNTLAAALKAAGLIDTLKGAGPFTVFAPTDDAFAKLPPGTVDDLLKPENKDKLIAILTYHVVSGKDMAKDIQGMSTVKTLNGKELPIKVQDGKVMVGSATVTKADIETSNGVIHVIDTVLIPG
jgi:transforming growth factor-beta-induced protein